MPAAGAKAVPGAGYTFAKPHGDWGHGHFTTTRRVSQQPGLCGRTV